MSNFNIYIIKHTTSIDARLTEHQSWHSAAVPSAQLCKEPGQEIMGQTAGQATGQQ